MMRGFGIQVERYTFIDRNHNETFETAILGMVSSIPLSEIRAYLYERDEPAHVLFLANYTRVRI